MIAISSLLKLASPIFQISFWLLFPFKYPTKPETLHFWWYLLTCVSHTDFA